LYTSYSCTLSTLFEDKHPMPSNLHKMTFAFHSQSSALLSNLLESNAEDTYGEFSAFEILILESSAFGDFQLLMKSLMVNLLLMNFSF
jgi:hypothetical protein